MSGQCKGSRTEPMYVDSTSGVRRGGCPHCGRNPRVTKDGKLGLHKAETQR